MSAHIKKYFSTIIVIISVIATLIILSLIQSSEVLNKRNILPPGAPPTGTPDNIYRPLTPEEAQKLR